MFDDIIREKANEHEAPVPPDAWDNIANQKKKRRFGFFWWSGIAMLLCGLCTAGYFISSQSGNKGVAVENKTKPVAEEKNNAANPAVEQQVEIKTSTAEVATEKANSHKTIDVLHPSAIDKSNSDGKNTNGNISIQSTSPLPEETSGAIVSKSEKKTFNNMPLLAANTRKKKSSKGKARYSSTTPEPEEINNISEKENPADEATASSSEEKEKIETSIINNIEGNKTPVPVNKNLPAIKEDKTLVKTKEKASTEIKKENIPLTKQTRKHCWFLDAGIVPLLVSSQFDENVSFNRTLFSNNNLTVYNASLLKTTIAPSVAFSLAVRRQLSIKITIGTGLQYLLLKENLRMEGKETNTQYNVVNRLVNGALVADTVATVTEGTRSIDAVNSYHLYSIPVFMQYSIIEKTKWNLSAVSGLYINVNNSYQNEIDRNASAPLQPTPAIENKTTTGVDMFAGIRIGKTLGKRFEFFAMPSMRWNISKYDIKNSLVNKKINQTGVGFGLSYKIN